MVEALLRILLNYTSFHMCGMVRFEIGISASVGGFSVNFSGQCHPFPDNQNVQKRKRILDDRQNPSVIYRRQNPSESSNKFFFYLKHQYSDYS
jgi:hypothetical protein